MTLRTGRHTRCEIKRQAPTFLVQFVRRLQLISIDLGIPENDIDVLVERARDQLGNVHEPVEALV